MRVKVNNKSNNGVIITRTPMRITLGGGGTDVIWYSKLRGGAWISAAINKYVYIFVNKTNDLNGLKIFDGDAYFVVEDINEIANPVMRECLKIAKAKNGIQIITISQVSSRSGLGGSGSFEVGLINALYNFQHKNVSKFELAKQATNIEIIRLKKSVGPQDQYIAALGGINYFEIDKKGKVTYQELKLSKKTLEGLQQNLLYFSTGIKRDADGVLKDAKNKSESKDSKVIEALDKIKQIGQDVKKNLEKGQIDAFGQSLHRHWLIKKSLSEKVSNTQIDDWYNLGIENGALGGKIMGAGGGGWFVFYVNKNHDRFKKEMHKLGLIPQDINFDWKGTTVLYG